MTRSRLIKEASISKFLKFLASVIGARGVSFLEEPLAIFRKCSAASGLAAEITMQSRPWVLISERCNCKLHRCNVAQGAGT